MTVLFVSVCDRQVCISCLNLQRPNSSSWIPRLLLSSEHQSQPSSRSWSSSPSVFRYSFCSWQGPMGISGINPRVQHLPGDLLYDRSASRSSWNVGKSGDFGFTLIGLMYNPPVGKFIWARLVSTSLRLGLPGIAYNERFVP